MRAFARAAALSGLLMMLTITKAEAFTANKVWFEARPNGIYRVHVNYTVPALREFREAYVEFKQRKEAEAFYWDAVRGADVFLDDPTQRRFVNQPLEPRPW
jgi:hypothetical protein